MIEQVSQGADPFMVVLDEAKQTKEWSTETKQGLELDFSWSEEHKTLMVIIEGSDLEFNVSSLKEAQALARKIESALKNEKDRGKAYKIASKMTGKR
jgi:hypothetical protein